MLQHPPKDDTKKKATTPRIRHQDPGRHQALTAYKGPNFAPLNTAKPHSPPPHRERATQGAPLEARTPASPTSLTRVRADTPYACACALGSFDTPPFLAARKRGRGPATHTRGPSSPGAGAYDTGPCAEPLAPSTPPAPGAALGPYALLAPSTPPPVLLSGLTRSWLLRPPRVRNNDTPL